MFDKIGQFYLNFQLSAIHYREFVIISFYVRYLHKTRIHELSFRSVSSIFNVMPRVRERPSNLDSLGEKNIYVAGIYESLIPPLQRIHIAMNSRH